MILKPGSRISHYRLIEKIGEGGMGEVFKAHDTKLNRDVALKVLPAAVAHDRERMARFEREAQVLASLSHPHVGAIYGIEDAGESKALVLELIEGMGLNQRIQEGPLPIDEALRLAEQIAAGLEAAHDKGIIHRDLKPANVKITHDGNAKVLDFGLAKALDDSNTPSGTEITQSPTFTMATQAGVVLGTAAYMAPEQARGKPTDRRADVWAFGVVLYEMLTAHHLFGGDTVTDILAAVVRAEPDWERLPAETPATLRRLIRRCLAKDPAKRMRDIVDVRLELHELIEGTHADDEAMALRPPQPSSLSRFLPWGLAAIMAAAAIAIYVAGGRKQERQVLNTSILPPEGTNFDLRDIGPGSPTISPDGRMVVFSAVDRNGERSLYIRRLDAPEAHAVSGTDDAHFPFWSADSRYVGFFTHNTASLKKIAVAGGPPTTICAATRGKGGTWNRDGVIVFAPSFNSTIHRVQDTGGTSIPITTINPDSAEVSHRLPYFLPDGRRFLYLVRRSNRDNELRLGSLDGEESQTLMTAEVGAIYASGHVLYAVDRTLIARALDPRSGKLASEAFPVAEDLTVLVEASMGCFSASTTGDLLFVGGGKPRRSRLVWYDRDGTRLGLLGDEADYREVSLSPDGTMAAVLLVDPMENSQDIWIYEIARNLRTRFTLGPGREHSPTWSPDSRQLYYGDDESGGRVFVRAVGGSDPPQPVPGADSLSDAAISPDGRYLVGGAYAHETSWDIWVLPLERGAQAFPFSQERQYEANGRISPDGRWMAYYSWVSNHGEVYVKPFPGPGRRWRVSTGGGRYPMWSPDGRRLFYQVENEGAFGFTSNATVMAAELEVTGKALNIGEPIRILESSFYVGDYRYAVATDGRILVIENVEEQGTLAASLIVNWVASLGRTR